MNMAVPQTPYCCIQAAAAAMANGRSGYGGGLAGTGGGSLGGGQPQSMLANSNLLAAARQVGIMPCQPPANPECDVCGLFSGRLRAQCACLTVIT